MNKSYSDKRTFYIPIVIVYWTLLLYNFDYKIN